MKLFLREWAAGLAIGLALLGCGSKSSEELILSARAKLANHEESHAIVELKNALQLSPDSAEGRFLLGMALLDSGNPVAAMVEFRKAQSLHYDQAEVIPAIARTMLVQNDYRKLIEEFANETLPSPKSTAELMTSLALAYAALSDAGKSAAAVDVALDVVPDHVPALLVHARLAAAKNKFSEADAFIEKAESIAPKDPEVWLYRADSLLIGHGDAAGAKKAYRKALDLAPHYVAARSNLASLLIAERDYKGAEQELALLRKARANIVQTQFLDTQLAFGQGDAKKANELIQQVLKVAPDNVRALLLAGSIEALRGEVGAAERSLNKALSLAPESAEARRQLARIQIRKGEAERALVTLSPLIKPDQTDAVAHVLAAEASTLRSAYADARVHLVEAIRLNPKDVRTRAKLALVQLNSGAADAAMVELKSIAASSADTFADQVLVNSAMANKDNAGALKALDALEAKQPGKASNAELRGRILLGQGKLPEARASFERAVKLDPVYMPAVVALARLDQTETHTDLARKRFEAVLAIDPRNLGALLALASIRSEEGAPDSEVVAMLGNAIKLNPSEAAPRLLLVNFQAGHKDIKAALAAARDAEAALPENADVVDVLGRMQAVSGDTLQAITSFKKLATLEPRSIRAPMRLAGVYLGKQDFEAAEQSFKRALDISPDTLVAQQGLVETQLAANRGNEALAYARALQKRRADNAIGFLLEARVHVFRKAYGDAATIYAATLKRMPTTEIATRLYAALMAASRNAEAEKAAANWLARNPKDAAFIAFIGDSAMARNDFAAAETLFRRFLDLQPDNPRALNNVALMLMKQGKAGARELAERANRLRPNSPELIDTLASALAYDKQFDAAVKLQRRAIELSPSDPLLRLGLAKVYIQAGTPTPARQELEGLVKLGDRFAQQAEVAQLLKAL